MNDIKNYEDAIKLYVLKNHACRCIDGRMTGIANCVAFCKSDEHTGFLTKKLMIEHGCHVKNCNKFIRKPTDKKADVSNKPMEDVLASMDEMADKVFELAFNLTKDTDGMRVMNATLKAGMVCEIEYVAPFGDCDLSGIIKQIETELKPGIKIKAQRLDRDFDYAVKCIMEKKSA